MKQGDFLGVIDLIYVRVGLTEMSSEQCPRRLRLCSLECKLFFFLNLYPLTLKVISAVQCKGDFTGISLINYTYR